MDIIFTLVTKKYARHHIEKRLIGILSLTTSKWLVTMQHAKLFAKSTLLIKLNVYQNMKVRTVVIYEKINIFNCIVSFFLHLNSMHLALKIIITSIFTFEQTWLVTLAYYVIP